MNVRTVMLLVVVASITAGSLFVGPRFINPLSMDPVAVTVLFSIRMPRVVISLLMGTALGASGAVLQGILRNPLADPYILGISSGAGLTAALGLLLGAYFFGQLTVPILAFGGALLTGIAVGTIGYRRGGLWPERLLLAGIGISFLFSALLTLVMGVSSNEGMRRAVLWISGDLSLADWPVVPYGAVFTALGLVLALWRSRALNALMLGDEIAHSL
ncbi:MAG: FecCD family ABC transporter permease, partial [Thermodesulfovibrionales bacterium]